MLRGPVSNWLLLIACGFSARETPALGTYVLKNSSKTWVNAKATCQREGMQLAMITDEDQAIQASAALAQQGVNKAWFGLRLRSGTTWRLVNGSKAEFFYWSSGEPSKKHTCVVLGSGAGISKRWRTASCSKAKPFLCQVRSQAAATVTTSTQTTTAAWTTSAHIVGGDVCSRVQTGDVLHPVSYDITCGEVDVDVSRKFAVTYSMPIRPAIAISTETLSVVAATLKSFWHVEMQGRRLSLQRDDLDEHRLLEGGTTYTIEAIGGQSSVVDLCGRRLAPFSCNFTTKGPFTSQKRVTWRPVGILEVTS